ncbi:MAG: hypothetical protein AAGD05_07595 [Bacteroidota bacterium]
MLNTNLILKAPQFEDSQNYALLREQGLKHIENLAKQIWTDYNLHDPGVSILELLCYAISDLGYRTGFDIKDLLTEDNKGTAFIDESVFHTAQAIFPSHPVSFDDLRKLLIDIKGVKQAWVSINQQARYFLDLNQQCLAYPEPDHDHYEHVVLNGLYDVLIQKEDFVVEQDRVSVVKSIDPEQFAPNNYAVPIGQGIEFKVRYPLTVQSVVLYYQIPDHNIDANLEIHFSLRDEMGVFQLFNVRHFKLSPDHEQSAFVLNLEESLGTGEWRISAQGTNLELGIDDSNTTQYPYTSPGLLELLQGFDGNSNDHHCYFFFNWQTTFAVSPLAQEAQSQLEEVSDYLGPVEPAALPFDRAVSVSGKGLLFNVICPIQLISVTLFADAAQDCFLILYDRNDVELQRVKHSIVNANGPERVELHWEVSPGMHYRIKAFGAGGSVKLFRNKGVNFPFVLDNVLEIINGVNGNNFNDIYYYFYHWEIAYTPCLVPTSVLTLADIQAAVKERLYQYRNLCEDFMHIRALKTESISVCMDLEVRPEVDLGETLAEIYHRLERYVSPPVNFYSIQELLDRGKTPDQIFEGPLLDHGFIDDDEFQQLNRRECLRTSDVIQIIMDVPGVIAVKSIALLSFIEIEESAIQPNEKIFKETDQAGQTIYYRVREEEWVLPLRDHNLYAPDFSPKFMTDIPHVIVKGYRPCLEGILSAQRGLILTWF